jgi:hypothetical protein
MLAEDYQYLFSYQAIRRFAMPKDLELKNSLLTQQ